MAAQEDPGWSGQDLARSRLVGRPNPMVSQYCFRRADVSVWKRAPYAETDLVIELMQSICLSWQRNSRLGLAPAEIALKRTSQVGLQVMPVHGAILAPNGSRSSLEGRPTAHTSFQHPGDDASSTRHIPA